MIPLIDFLICVALFLVMFTIGLSLYIKDFKRIFRRPKKLSVGLVSQLILLPLLVFILLELFGVNLPPEIKVGILILAICPGGSASNFISYLVKADVPLSISMTSANTLITLFSIPLLVNIFLRIYLGKDTLVSLPFLHTFLNLFLIVIIPVLAGIYIREKKSDTANKLEKPLKIFSIILLAGVFAVKIFAGEAQGGSGLTLEKIWLILPILLLVHFASLFLGFFNSKAFNLNNKSAVTIGIEVGLQNTGLALLVTSNLLGNQIMVQPILVYAMFSFFTTFGFAYIMKRVLIKKN